MNNVAKAMMLGLFLTASTAAIADPVTLVCHMKPGPIYEDGPTTIELNEAQSSVVVHFSGRHDSNVRIDASSLGPVPAQFSANTITFAYPSNASIRYVINRLTGDFGGFIPGGQNAWENFTCQAAQKQF